MKISSYRQVQAVEDEAALVSVLKLRDELGGGEFWLADEDGGYPCLAIVVSGDMSHTTYFPEEGHPGFRCLRPPGGSLPPGGHATFVWVGCDPKSGEHVPNEFIVPFSASLSITKEFLRCRILPPSVQWFEL